MQLKLYSFSLKPLCCLLYFLLYFVLFVFIFFGAETDFRRQIITSLIDPRTEGVK